MTAKTNLTKHGNPGVLGLRSRLRAEEMLGRWASVVRDPGCGICVGSRYGPRGSGAGQFLRADYLTVEAALARLGLTDLRPALALCWFTRRGPRGVVAGLAGLRAELLAVAASEVRL